MGLYLRMLVALGLLFGTIYALVVVIAAYAGLSGYGLLIFSAVLASGFLFLQYLIGPSIVDATMKVRYVSEAEEPELHAMVSELARNAKIKKPRVGIAEIGLPNAFAYGRSTGDARVCVTRGILRLLNKDELRAVLGHEISHIKHRDVMVITALSVVPLLCWFVARSLLFSGTWAHRRNVAYLIALGVLAFIVYFISQLIVLWVSRIREHYADRGSVALGNRPHWLASALYKLVYGCASTPAEVRKAFEGCKAFFLNDPSRAYFEVRELREVDTDMSGTIDPEELEALRTKKVRLTRADKLMELLSTHPNTLKRIKFLSSLRVF